MVIYECNWFISIFNDEFQYFPRSNLVLVYQEDTVIPTPAFGKYGQYNMVCIVGSYL